MKKAVSIGTSAALLASLFTAIVAAPVAADVSVTGVGVVPRGGTSTDAATFVFTENVETCVPAAGGSFTVTLTDSADAATVQFSGTPTVVSPVSLGPATASASGNVLTVTMTASNNTAGSTPEQITVSGLKIKALETAAAGAINATIGGAQAGCFAPATTTATGVVAIGIAAGSTSVTVNVDNCAFVDTDTTDAKPGPLVFATAADSRNITTAGAIDTPGPGQQVLQIQATTKDHQIGEVVSQTGVPTGTATCSSASLASPGTVRDVLKQTATSKMVFPGESNQLAGTTTLAEIAPTVGFFKVNEVVTFTLPTGVKFSGASANGLPTLTAAGAGFTLTSGTCAISIDRQSCTAKVATLSTASASITLGNVWVDVDSTVAPGTKITATATTSLGKSILVDSNVIATTTFVVFNAGSQPIIYIGENDQSSGQLTLTERGAGFFTGSTGTNNAFALCIATGEYFTRAPYAVVTAGTGLTLVDPATSGSSTSVKGTLYSNNQCAKWNVFAPSTAAATIEIRGADATGAVLASGATNGPRLNVPAGLRPGTTQMNLLIGLQADIDAADTDALAAVVTNAVRAFRNGVAVAAVSQPTIPRGSVDSLGGNLTITETQAGQFKAGEFICVEVLPHLVTTTNSILSDVFLKSANTNDRPVVTTNTSTGLLVSPVSFGCGETDETSVYTSFGFSITQQGTGTLGQITVSNIHYITTADAVNGAVLIRVENQSQNGVDFEAVVSNAKVGTAAVVKMTAATALGVTKLGPFTTSTKVQRAGKYVTWRFTGGAALAGKHVEIWVATRGATAWSAFKKLTGRVADANGNAYFSWRNTAGKWISVRARYAGDASHSASVSPARQARWR